MRENPFKSKSQARLFFAKEARGELAPGTAERWMDETPNFASLPEYVGENPDEDEPLVIQMFYSEGPQYWNRGMLVETRTFWEANQQLELWGDSGRAAFVVYIMGELVYGGSYDLSMKPADLRRQMVIYLEQLGTEDADRLLDVLIKRNPELKRGYIDPDTGAWMSRRRFEERLDEIEDAVVSETITEDQPTVDAINAALLAGTIGIGTSGLVTEATMEQIREGTPDPARIPHTLERQQRRRPFPGRRQQQGRQADLFSDHADNMEAMETWLTVKYGLALGPSADWISSAWKVGVADDREVFIVDDERADEHDNALFSIVGRKWDDERDEYDDHVYLIDTFTTVINVVAPCAVCGEFLAGNTCCSHVEGWELPQDDEDEPGGLSIHRAREIIAGAREDLGHDLGGYSIVDLLADNSTASLERIREVLAEIGEPIDVPLERGDPRPDTVLTEQFGRARPLPWNPAIDGWFLGGSRWVQYRRLQPDGTAIYSVVNWSGTEVETLFTGRVDEVIPWLLQNLADEIGAERTVGHGYRVTPEMARGARRISSNDPYAGAQTYIVDGEYDDDGFTQWVNDAVGFLNEHQARSDMTHFPYRDLDERVPYRGQNELFRLHGPWRIEERVAVFKHRKADGGFINRFRLFSAGISDEGQRVQLFFDSGQPGSIRDVVITTWLAGFHAGENRVTVGFRLINGDNGIEIMNGQVNVPAHHGDWNKGHSTVRKIMDLLGVRAVFDGNGWPEEYYLNVGYADNPFVYF